MQENVVVSFKDTDDSNQMAFVFRDIEGVVTIKRFNVERWVDSLNEFATFLKGCGYYISNDSIGINSKHEPSETLINVTVFDQ